MFGIDSTSAAEIRKVSLSTIMDNAGGLDSRTSGKFHKKLIFQEEDVMAISCWRAFIVRLVIAERGAIVSGPFVMFLESILSETVRIISL